MIRRGRRLRRPTFCLTCVYDDHHMDMIGHYSIFFDSHIGVAVVHNTNVLFCCFTIHRELRMLGVASAAPLQYTQKFLLYLWYKAS